VKSQNDKKKHYLSLQNSMWKTALWYCIIIFKLGSSAVTSCISDVHSELNTHSFN